MNTDKVDVVLVLIAFTIVVTAAGLGVQYAQECWQQRSDMLNRHLDESNEKTPKLEQWRTKVHPEPNERSVPWEAPPLDLQGTIIVPETIVPQDIPPPNQDIPDVPEWVPGQPPLGHHIKNYRIGI